MLGFLNISKPPGITAHDVVARVRKYTGIKQVGHGGTLDPMATGVLPIAIGKACRLLRFLPGQKVYLAEILLGTSTDTDDIEGRVINICDKLPDQELVSPSLQKFIGPINQIPPAYSAVHHQGQRLYALARKGQIPENVNQRSVTITALEILDIALPVVRLRIACSAGTYIRAIARDLGQLLQCGGCLKSLVREQAGPFVLEDALSLDALKSMSTQGEIGRAIISPGQVLTLEKISLDKQQTDSLLMGQSISISFDKPEHDDPILACFEDAVIAVCRMTLDRKLKPEVVIGRSE